MPAERRLRQERERRAAIQRMDREPELRTVVQTMFSDSATTPAAIARIVHQHLTATEIDDLIVGTRPMSDLPVLLRRFPREAERDDETNHADCHAEGGTPTDRS